MHFHLSQGLRKFRLLKFCIYWNNICFLACLKAKTEEKRLQRFFRFFRSKSVLAILWNFKKYYATLILNFLISDCSFMYTEGFCKFSHKKILFIKSPCDFLKMKTLPRARPNLQIFWNWPPKNIPDKQKRVAFRKSQKKR